MKDHIHSEVKDQLLNHLNDKKPDPDHDYVPPVTAITLGNGVVMSVQASKNHYCHPRINYGIWDSVEVYIDPKYYKDVPDEPLKYNKYYKDVLDELLKYNEEHGDDPVMGYVPIDLVVAVIITSGGIDEIKMTGERK